MSAHTGCCEERGGFPFFKLVLIGVLVAIIWFSVAHALDGHSDADSWAAKEAARNNPCWQGTNQSGRKATVGQYQKNGDDVFGLCFDEPGVDGDEYITSYPSRKSTLDEIIDMLTRRGFE